jgi:hypothetical protein
MRALVPALAVLCVGCRQDVTILKPGKADVLFQNPPTEVDILLIVDDSGSMEGEQVKLAAGFAEFVEFFDVADVDYHIAVTTTDMTAEGLRGELVEVDGTRVIDRDTEDAETVFRAMVEVGILGSGLEKGLETALRALTEPLASGENAGFLREDALLSVIFVTDEEDASPGPTSSYINSFRELKGQRRRDAFNASALIGWDADSGEPSDCGQVGTANGAVAGWRYWDVAEQTGGVLGSICSDEFNDIVREMGLASSRLLDVFSLTHVADEETLDVAIHLPGTDEFEGDGLPLPRDGIDGQWPWVYEEDEEGFNAWLRFTDRGSLPPIGSKLVVRYELP